MCLLPPVCPFLLRCRPSSVCINCVRKTNPLRGQRKAMIRFSNSKLLLCLPPCLHTPHSAEPFVLDTDATNVDIGAVLSQVHNGEKRVIAYYSRALSKPERNYCTTRRELLEVSRAIENLHHCLYGRKFTVTTYHASLQWLLSFNNLGGTIGKVARKIACSGLRDSRVR